MIDRQFPHSRLTTQTRRQEPPSTLPRLLAWAAAECGPWLGLGRSPEARQFPTNHLDRLGDRGGGACCPARVDGLIVDLAAELLADRSRDLVRTVVLEVHAAARAIALEPVAHVEVLLEVVPQREVEERPAVRSELHRRRQPALDDP